MDSLSLQALIDLRVDLLRDLKCDKSMLEHLSKASVLSDKDLEGIQESASTEEKTRTLLNLLPKLGDRNVWKEFIASLRTSERSEHQHLAHRLEGYVRRLGDDAFPALKRSCLVPIMDISNTDEQECSYFASQDGLTRSDYALSPVPTLTHDQHYEEEQQTDNVFSPFSPQHARLDFGSGYAPSLAASTPTNLGYQNYVPPRDRFRDDRLRAHGQAPSALPPRSQFGSRGHGPAAGSLTPSALGVDFHTLTNEDLESLASQLDAQLGANFQRFVTHLLCDIPRYQQNAMSALRHFQRQRGIRGDVNALLRLWMEERRDQACTGSAVFDALCKFAPGTAMQCRPLLQVAHW